MKEWIQDLCPEIADWQAELIAQHAQPKREWVDLTREEFAEILCDDRWQFRPELMMLQVQAKLKERNA